MSEKKSVQVDDSWTDNSGIKKQEILAVNKQIAKGYMIREWEQSDSKRRGISFPEYRKMRWGERQKEKEEKGKLKKKSKRKKTALEYEGQKTLLSGFGPDAKKKVMRDALDAPIHHLCFYYHRMFGGCIFVVNDSAPCKQMCPNFICFDARKISYRVSKKGLKSPVTWFDLVNTGKFTYKEKKRRDGKTITIIHETAYQSMSSLDQYKGDDKNVNVRAKKNVAQVPQFSL